MTTFADLADRHCLKVCNECGEALSHNMYDLHSTIETKKGWKKYYHCKCRLCRSEIKQAKDERRAANIRLATQQPIIHVLKPCIEKTFFCTLAPTEIETRERKYHAEGR